MGAMSADLIARSTSSHPVLDIVSFKELQCNIISHILCQAYKVRYRGGSAWQCVIFATINCFGNVRPSNGSRSSIIIVACIRGHPRPFNMFFQQTLLRQNESTRPQESLVPDQHLSKFKKKRKWGTIP
jgi:hypothetical protein